MSDVCDIHNTKDLCINTNRAESQCYWCSMIEKCSNGRDYHADIWMKNGCDANNISQPQRSQNLTPKGMRESAVQTTNENNINSNPVTIIKGADLSLLNSYDNHFETLLKDVKAV
uniref:Uncharacterized protein n=1 Tax=Schistosoma haematobium TaxID=6185 RepID=A0A094ZE06_SCHHA